MARSKDAEDLLELEPAERRAELKLMSHDQRLKLRTHWRLWAHDGQVPPHHGWHTWLIMAGRGYGKTRAGAEWVREVAEADGAARIALVGASLGEARRVMVEGPSGLLAIGGPSKRPVFEPSKRELTWPNGAMATLYSAGEPESLRGPQHSHASRAKTTIRPRRLQTGSPGSSGTRRPAPGPTIPASWPRTRRAAGSLPRPAMACRYSTDRRGRTFAFATAGNVRQHPQSRPAAPRSIPRRGRRSRT